MQSGRRGTEHAGKVLRHAMLSALVLHGLFVILGPPLLIQRPVIREWNATHKTRAVVLEPETKLTRLRYSPEPDRPDIPAPGAVSIEKTDGPLPVHPTIEPPGIHVAGLSGGGTSDYTMVKEMSPRPIIMVDPEYPPIARAAEAEGTVKVRAVVDGSGMVTRVTIESSDTIALLEYAALKAAKKWRFRPAKQGDVPVQVIVIIPFTFRM